ncbi:DUF2538 family protein [Sporosarcina sp. BP05]|uniref:DUF2538 family protein n=1 Tax=Sporosarcina sp. BP05 TaxID=2758726 RepID=UPI0016442526|nr:DUF2538 family protein [Sporosarcina sp. BP05]
MTEIYFINKQHEINFKRVLMKWNLAKVSTEYSSACYILSVPMIFEKVENHIAEFENPISWIYLYEWQHTLSKMAEYQDDKEDELEEVQYDLTHSMIQLGRFSLNMWNGYEHFNLLDCIARLDEQYYNVLKCAMDVRMGKVAY